MSDMGPLETAGRRIGAWFDRYGPLALTLTGTGIIGFSTNLIGTSGDMFALRAGTLVWWAGFVAFGLGSYFLAGRQTEIESLKTDLTQITDVLKTYAEDLSEFWRRTLASIAADLGLSDSDRISLYRHEDGVFIMLGRYSLDPSKQKTGRGFYPANQGSIGEAFRQGQSLVCDLPEAETPEYKERVLQAGYSENEYAHLTMRPRSIAAFAIQDAIDRIGVIVLESSRANAFEAAKVKSVVIAHERTLILMLSKLRTLEPSRKFAASLGWR